MIMDCYVFETMLEEVERDLPLPESARAQALEHAESCAYCRARLAAARLLSLELQALAREDEKLQAPPRVQAGLMAAFRARSERAPRVWRRLSWAGVAAAVAIAVWLAAAYGRRQPVSQTPRAMQARRSAPTSRTPNAEIAGSASAAQAVLPVHKAKKDGVMAGRQARPPRPGLDASRAAADVGNEFIALSGGSYPMGDGVIVRVQVPRSAPALVGLPVSGGDFSGTITADVVLGEDGVARAIRFVQPQQAKAAKNSDFTPN